MNALASLLEKYYRKESNKIVFKNGQSLNELAMQMWERLGFRGMDASTLSRIINGRRLFTYRQLEVFCQILRLSPKDRLGLKNKLIEATLSRHSLKSSFNDFNDFYKEINKPTLINIVNTIHILREKGKIGPLVTISQLVSYFFKIYPVLFCKYKDIYAIVYNEEARAHGLTLLPSQVLKKMIPLIITAHQIGLETKNKNILNMNYMNMGGGLYVAKQWQKSAFYLEKHMNEADAETRIEFIRTLLLDYAYLNNRNKYRWILNKAENILSQNSALDFNNLASLVEAMARSQTMFGYHKEADKLLAEFENRELSPFFESQIVRGKIATEYYKMKHNKKVDIDKIRELNTQANQEKFKPFKRHKQQIKNYVKSIVRHYE